MTKKKENIPRLIFERSEDIYDYFDTENKDLLVDVFNGIRYGFNQNSKDVDVFEVQRQGLNRVLVFNIPKKEWQKNLKIIMNSFVSMEEYEHAAEVKKLMNNIKEE